MTKISFSFNSVSQMSHVGWGMAGVWGLILLVRFDVMLAVVIMTIVATLKEGLFDVLLEDTETRGNGVEDWVFWMVGIGAAAFLYLWRTL